MKRILNRLNKKNELQMSERREFVRLGYESPLMYKVCKRKTFSSMMQGYTYNISQTGLRCNIADKVNPNSILWLQLDLGALNMCSEIENHCVIIQKGVLGKVVWAKPKSRNNYDIGVRFITREEKHNDSWIMQSPILTSDHEEKISDNR